jgi:hypothetical protein
VGSEEEQRPSEQYMQGLDDLQYCRNDGPHAKQKYSTLLCLTKHQELWKDSVEKKQKEKAAN